METLYKILDVLLETLGPAAVKEHVDKQGSTPPAEQKKIIIKKVKKSAVDDLTTALEGMSIQKAAEKPKQEVDVDALTSQLQNLVIQKAEPKPKAKESRRCDARIYGEKVLLEGTTSPSGKPYAVYKHAQCEGKASHSIADEDDGKLYLCKICMKRYTSRQDVPVNWHGFFDVDDPPDTSHFVNGKWHRAKLAAAGH
jgi:hypothetical protein